MSSPTPANTPYIYKARRERGVWLRIWLAASTIFTLIASLLVVQILNALASRPEITVPTNKWISIGLFSMMILATLVFLRAIALWRKWGVYGMVVVSLISPLIKQELTTINIVDWIAPFVQIGVVILLMSNRWDDFN